MAKWLHDDVIENGPQYIIDNGTHILASSGQPPDEATADTVASVNQDGGKLAKTTLTTPTLADGDTDGRKIDIPAHNGVATESGFTDFTWDHVSIIDDASGKLLAVTTMSTNRTVSDTDSVDIAAFDLEASDPQ